MCIRDSTYTHIHIHTHSHIHTHIHTYTHRNTHIHIHTHTYTLTQTHTHTYIHTHTHTFTHIHTHIHSHIHTHIHTHTHTPPPPPPPTTTTTTRRKELPPIQGQTSRGLTALIQPTRTLYKNSPKHLRTVRVAPCVQVKGSVHEVGGLRQRRGIVEGVVVGEAPQGVVVNSMATRVGAHGHGLTTAQR